MNLLASILTSGIRAEIFTLFFNGLNTRLHNREIARKCRHKSEGSIRRELGKLEKLDILCSVRDGNRKYYYANTTHPLYNDLCNIVGKTTGIASVLRRKLRDRKIKISFIFGSVARGDEKGSSDVDLMVIGDIGLRKVAALIKGIPDRTGREINPYVLDNREFLKKVKTKDHFMTTVMKGPKVFVKGTEDGLKGLGR